MGSNASVWGSHRGPRGPLFIWHQGRVALPGGPLYTALYLLVFVLSLGASQAYAIQGPLLPGCSTLQPSQRNSCIYSSSRSSRSSRSVSRGSFPCGFIKAHPPAPAAAGAAAGAASGSIATRGAQYLAPGVAAAPASSTAAAAAAAEATAAAEAAEATEATAREAGKAAATGPLSGVSVSLSTLIRCPQTWDQTPSLLRGPIAYEATVVSLLKAAGARIVSPSQQQQQQEQTAGNHAHLAVSPLPPLQQRPIGPPRSSSSTSSSSSGADWGVLAEGPSVGGAPHLAFCASRGSVSLFGCFTAAAALSPAADAAAEDLLHAADKAAAAATDVAAVPAAAAAGALGCGSPLLSPSWGAPGLWLCANNVGLLQRLLGALWGPDAADLQSVCFARLKGDKKGDKYTPQQTAAERRHLLHPRVALLQIGDTAAEHHDKNSAPSRHLQLLQRLQQLQQEQQQQQQVPAARLDGDTLERATVGLSLLQCCEAATLLLRLGEGAPQGPPKDIRETETAIEHAEHEQQQQQQQQQHEQQQQQQEEEEEQQQPSFKMRVVAERQRRLSPQLQLRMLLGGVILRDKHKHKLLEAATAARQQLQQQLLALLSHTDVLLHLGGPTKGPPDETKVPPPLPLEGKETREGPFTQQQQQQQQQPQQQQHQQHHGVGSSRSSEGPHEQLIAAAAALGFPCFVSSDGWLLLGAPGRDTDVLAAAAALNTNPKP